MKALEEAQLSDNSSADSAPARAESFGNLKVHKSQQVVVIFVSPYKM
jgi:hypothetical protein